MFGLETIALFGVRILGVYFVSYFVSFADCEESAKKEKIRFVFLKKKQVEFRVIVFESSSKIFPILFNFFSCIFTLRYNKIKLKHEKDFFFTFYNVNF